MTAQVVDLDADMEEYGKKLITKYALRFRSLMLRASQNGNERTTPVLRGGRRRKRGRKRGPIVNPGVVHAQGGSTGDPERWEAERVGSGDTAERPLMVCLSSRS